ncbi:hypothetical protein C3920_00125 [Novacetimonas pomaceti]|uniref:Uncharacterized protein n=1 Tax=Novacetimonas pomaceti TaxID=2021998 RepID=A0ABX5P6A6_9PROT|nr:hypothetical protein C3920_00125 [Novacetimonas pomaceti]
MKIIRVFGEAFCKKLHEDVTFLKKGDTQKLLSSFINNLFSCRLYIRSGECAHRLMPMRAAHHVMSR